MGGGPRFPAPKWVWTPFGGWWPHDNVPNKARSAVLATTFFVGAFAAVFSFSASREKRPRPNQMIPLPSQRWCKRTLEDDPNYYAKREAYLKSKKPWAKRLLPDSWVEEEHHHH